MNKFLIFTYIISIFISCQQPSPRSVKVEKDDLKKEASLQFLQPKKLSLPSTLEITGDLQCYPSGRIIISALKPGFIKKLYHETGDKVKKGSLLAKLEHPEYIKLQEEYLLVKNSIEYLEQDFTRKGELTIDNAISIKKFQEAQSLYREMEIKYLSLKTRCENLGINTE
ncbi:MAG: efflux RND transporter periplasmic adaptor subunit, partial [bacterium]